MDHFPTVYGAKPTAVVVPLLCEIDDVGRLEVSSYDPKYTSWKKRVEAEDPSKVEAFFQSWLYFGCLKEIFKLANVKFNIREFITENQNERFVNSWPLLRVLESWKERGSKIHDYEKEKQFHNIDKILGKVCHYTKEQFDYFQNHMQSSGIKSTTWPIISQSIVLLGWTLHSAGHRIYRAGRLWKSYWKDTGYSRERLMESGWCPTEIKKYTIDLGLDGLHYVSSLRSPRMEKEHTSCTEIVCTSPGIDEGDYEKQHASGCNKACKQIPAPETILEIIERGGIPLISYDREKSELRVVEYGPKKSYVAISHVWSDGLGNPTENSLWHCQLSRLQHLIETLYSRPQEEQNRHTWFLGPSTPPKHRDPRRKPVGFWLDTLCVPVHPDLREYRNKTIRKMRTIYEQADRTLILDNWIRELPRSAPITEKAARLYLSNWQHRLWTLQEGALAQNLFFQFEDGPDTLDNLLEEWKRYQESSPYFYCEFVGSMLTMIPVLSLKSKISGRSPVHEQFLAMLKALAGRTTTRKSDETICLSTLLDIDAKNILSINPKKVVPKEEEESEEKAVCEARMVLFLKELKIFDQIIIFNDLPRLEIDGYRWCPKSFLSQYSAIITDFPSSKFSRYPARLHDVEGGGLRVEYPGISLLSVGPHLGRKITVVRHDDMRYWCYVTIHPDQYGTYLTWDAKLSYAVISSHKLGGEQFPGIERRNTSAAIVGALQESDGRCLELLFKCRATLEWVEGDEIEVLSEMWMDRLGGPEREFTGEDEGYSEDFPVLGDWLRSGPLWYVK